MRAKGANNLLPRFKVLFYIQIMHIKISGPFSEQEQAQQKGAKAPPDSSYHSKSPVRAII